MRQLFLFSEKTQKSIFTFLVLTFLSINVFAQPPAPAWVTFTPTGTTTGTVTWDDSPQGSGAGYWYIALSTSPTFTGWAGAGGVAPMNSYDFTGLIPGTTYYAYVSSVETVGWTWNDPTRSDGASTFSIIIPTISSFSPATGAIGSSVTITGTGFNTTAGNNIVYFGATKATVTVASATSLTVTVPGGATNQNISVTNTANNLTAYSAKPYITTFATTQTIDAGAFATEVDFGVHDWSGIGIASGDFDGDGKPDVVVATRSENKISVLRNTGTSGTLSFATKIDYTTGLMPQGVRAVDVDGDGKLDIVVSNTNDLSISVFLNTSTPGTISFADKTDFALKSGGNDVDFADIDGDGKPDLISASDNYISVLLNTSTVGSISFAGYVYFSASAAQTLRTGDIDGDGKPDIVVANAYASSISVFRNTSTVGSILFDTKVDYTAAGFARGIAIGDLDGDGKLDIATGINNDLLISVFKNNSTSGTISLADKVDFATSTSNNTVTFADVDGDGKLDVLTSHVDVLKNNSTVGTISLAAAQSFSTGTTYGIAVADYDGDGKPDIASTYWGDPNINVLRNTIPSPLTTAPTANAASDITVTSFTANWTTLANADKYYLDVATDNGFTSMVTGFSNLDVSNVTSYSVTSLTGNTAYYYRVRGYNGSTSPNSDTVSATTLLLYFSGGDGSIGNPYQISSVNDLAALADSVNNGNTYNNSYFDLTTNLDLNVAPFNTGTGWIPIGGGEKGKEFQGHFNGNKHLIINLYINSSYNNIGLFGTITSGATVSNLGVEDANVVTTGSTTGIIVGNNSSGLWGKISNSYTTGSIQGYNTVGGIAGYCFGGSYKVQDCYSTATVKGNQYVGGIVGALQWSDVGTCFYSGTITANSDINGILGANWGATTHDNCFYDSTATGFATNDGRGIPIGVSQISDTWNFINAGWNLDDIWWVNSSPYLQGFTPRIAETITFDALSAKIYGDEPYTISATGGLSSNSVTFTSSNTSIATCTGTNGTTITILKAGTVTITASQMGDLTYSSAKPISRILTINKKEITLTEVSANNKTYDGTTDASINVNSVLGKVDGDDVVVENINVGVFASPNANTGITVTPAWSLSGTTADNYSLTIPTLTADIGKADQTIVIALHIPAIMYGDADVDPGAYSSSGLPVEYSISISDSSVAKIVDNKIHALSESGALLFADQPGNENYNAASQQMLGIQVVKKALSIIGATTENKQYDGNSDATVDDGTLVGVVGSDDVSISKIWAYFGQSNVGNDLEIFLDGVDLVGKDALKYRIQDVNTMTANITKADQTISFNALPTISYGDVDFDPSATINSYLEINYTSSDNSIASVVGNKIQALAVGTVTIYANQDGDNNYNAATEQSQTLTIGKKELTITGAVAANKQYDGGTDADVSGATLVGVINDDDVTLQQRNWGRFASENVGDNIVVNTFMTIEGSGTGKYTLTQPTLTANITTSLSTWDGTTWSPSSPTGSVNAVINGNYNNIGFSCNNLTINAGKQVTISSGTLAVNGNLLLKSDITGSATVIDNGGNIVVEGSTNVEQYLTTGRNWYISSPVKTATSNEIKSNPSNKLWIFDEGHFSWFEIIPNHITLDPLIGFVVNVAQTGVIPFVGTLNTGTQTFNYLTRTGYTDAKRGFNLLGNPYPSAVSFDMANIDNLDSSIWYRTQNGSNAYVFDTYNSQSGIGTNNNGSGDVTGIIPPMQAVWVHVKADDLTGSITFDNSMRSHPVTGNSLKSDVVKTNIRLKVSNNKNSDEAILVFNEKARNSYDGYDSPKMFADNADVPEIYTTAGSEKVVINGLNSIDSVNVIPLGFKTKKAGTFTISATEISGLAGVPVVLEDKLLNKTIDLTSVPTYTFTSDSAIDNSSRFALHLKSGLDVTASKIVKSGINIYAKDNSAIVTTTDNANGTVVVFNLLGQKIASGVLTGSQTVVSLPSVSGAYFVKVKTEKVVETKKIIVE